MRMSTIAVFGTLMTPLPFSGRGAGSRCEDEPDGRDGEGCGDVHDLREDTDSVLWGVRAFREVSDGLTGG